MRKILCLSVTLLLAQAQVGAADDIRWNGYLNIVGGMLEHAPLADQSSKKQYPAYKTYEDTVTFDPQTSAALQAVKKLDDRTSVTTQLFAEGATDNYSAKLKWLYLTYDASDNSTFRIGRIGNPVYYFSDYLNVGYAYHWITPPLEVYPFDTTNTGLDYIYRDIVGDFDWSMELLGGAEHEKVTAINTDTKTRNTLAAVLTASTGGWLNFRAMYYQSTASFKVDQLSPDPLINNAFDAAAAKYGVPASSFEKYRPLIAPQIQNALNLDRFKLHYGELALRAERDRWLLMGEWSTLRAYEYLYNVYDSWYITGGLRFGKAFYHLTFAEGKTQLHPAALADAAFKPANFSDAEVARGFASGIDSAVAGAIAYNRRSVTLGVRVETSAHSCVKFEVIPFQEKPSFAGETAGIGHNLLFRSALNAMF